MEKRWDDIDEENGSYKWIKLINDEIRLPRWAWEEVLEDLEDVGAAWQALYEDYEEAFSGASTNRP